VSHEYETEVFRADDGDLGIRVLSADESIRKLRAENERLQRIFNHLTRYASFWSAVRSAADHSKTLDEDRLSEADVAYLEGLS
jgi:hypothetical protein